MRIVQITPGSGDGFYCQNCLRDNEIVRALRRLGHDAVMVGLYLPPTTDGLGAPAGPIFFGGINVYLQQRFAFFRRTPRWLDRLFDGRRLLRWAGRRAGMTSSKVLGETTLSMLRGEHGRQVKELDRLLEWLSAVERADVVVLSNALLVGLAGRIRRDLGVPVACCLQDEDWFLDDLPGGLREQAWETIRRRSADVDVFLAVSDEYARVMTGRLDLAAGRVRVVRPGIDPEGYFPAQAPLAAPTIGFLSRMCPENGLDVLVEALALLKREPRLAAARLRAAGGWTARDEPFLDQVRGRLASAGLEGHAELLPNLARAERQAFLRTLSVLCVPQRRPEAFPLFALEALASGVPVLLASGASARELADATGGILLCEGEDPRALTDALGRLLLDEELPRLLARRGRQAVLAGFTADHAAGRMVQVLEGLSAARPAREDAKR